MSATLTPQLHAELVGKVEKFLSDGVSTPDIINGLSQHLQKLSVSDYDIQANNILNDAKTTAGQTQPVEAEPSIAVADVPEWQTPAHEEINVLEDFTENDILTMQTEAVAHLSAGKSIEETADELVKSWDEVTKDQMITVALRADELRKKTASQTTVVSLSSFREIALRSAARGESRVLPILVGGKNPLVSWKNTPIDTSSTEAWTGLSLAWIDEITAKFPSVNAAVIAKPYENLFLDEDESGRFRKGYEKFSSEPFPRTYTTSARADRCQSHWKQTDRTRAMGNVPQGSTIDGILSVRQNNLYVLAEGSQHKNGVDVYKTIDASPAVPMPDKMVDYILSIRTDRNEETGDFAKKPEGWLDAPFIHHNIDNQLISFAGHYISAKNISDADELETLLIAKLEKNGCFEPDGKTPFAYNVKRIREIAEDKVKTWKTGEQKRAETAVVFNQPAAIASIEPQAEQYAMTSKEVDAEHEKEFPVIPLAEQPGPSWEDDIMYGIAGEIVRKASQYCEAHPAGMYLDLLVSLGSIISRGPYFNINSTRHYTNESMARVGLTATARKGTGRDMIDEVLRLVDGEWFKRRILSGFGSAEAIINEVRDPMEQQVRDRKSPTGFRLVIVPGINDKRLCIREGELASVFQLAAKKESRADIVLRDSWDSKALRNVVKGKSDGLSNSAYCLEPHISVSGDTTRSELVKKMPSGAADNGFGNRFLYCHVCRVKMCPMGGPQLDWSKETIRLFEAVQWARGLTYVPLTKAASKVWGRMYIEVEESVAKMPGLAGAMCARAVAHIRRLALILALLDEYDVVETRHLHAAKKLWDYCQESARFIFQGTTSEQDRIVQFVKLHREVTLAQIRDGLFQRHKRAAWVEAQVNGIVVSGAHGIIRQGEKIIVVG